MSRYTQRNTLYIGPVQHGTIEEFLTSSGSDGFGQTSVACAFPRIGVKAI